jgi:succinate dehydrogenase / fumarate reductase flavoprotein subunit
MAAHSSASSMSLRSSCWAEFGPVIDRHAQNGIDLTRMPVEVAPMAHYHMGGIRCNARMESDISGLFGAGEVVGGVGGG